MRLAAAVVALLLSETLFGQETIRENVPLVVVPASVTDKDGRPIYGLTASDFIVLDKGTPRAVRVDVAEDGLAPIALAVLIQTTTFSSSALGKIKKTGAMIAGAVTGQDGEAAVITFSDDVRLVQDFTRDGDKITRAFRDLKASDGSGGRMIDATGAALDMIEKRPGPQRAAIVIIGETRDRGSKEKLSNLLQRTQHSGVTIYGITYSAYLTAFTTKGSEYQPPESGGLLAAITEPARLAKANTIQALTAATGGRRLGFDQVEA